MNRRLPITALTLAALCSGCVSTNLTLPDGTTMARTAFATSIGSLHSTGTKAQDGSYNVVIDEQAVDQTTAFASAMQAMAVALDAALKAQAKAGL
jgi:hypothetical protein